MKLLQLSDGSQAIVSDDPSSFEDLLLEKLGSDVADHFHSICDYNAWLIEDLKEENDRLENAIDDMYWDEQDELSDFQYNVGVRVKNLSEEVSKLKDYIETF